MKNKILLLSIIGITGCLQTSANDLQKTDPGTIIYDLEGSIVDLESKKPLKDVSVTAYLSSKKEKQVVTDEFGRFGFEEMRAGVYKLVFEKEGYRKVIKEKVTLKSEESFQMKIEMFEHDGIDLLPSQFHFFNF